MFSGNINLNHDKPEVDIWNLSSVGGHLRLSSRNEFLVATGTLAIIAGLVIPISAHFMDISLMFNVFLIAGIIMIAFCARGTEEVSGFPLLIILATAIRMMLSAASVRNIFMRSENGNIIGFLGDNLIGGKTLAAVFIFGVGAVLIFRVIYKAVRNISLNTISYTADMMPAARESIDSDFNAGKIDYEEARGLRGKIISEAGFFVATSGAAKFVFCGAIVEGVIATASIIFSAAIGMMAANAAGESLETHISMAIGSGAIGQVSILFTALGCGWLIKRSLRNSTGGSLADKQESRGTITVVAKEVGYCAEPQREDDHLANQNQEDIAKFWNWQEMQKAFAGEYDNESECGERGCYDAIADLIEGTSGEFKTMLLAAKSARDLPVTVPVNIAMRMAERNKRCLLIDLDFERNAIAKVFDIDEGRFKKEGKAKAVKTSVDNLWVWQSGKFGEAELPKIKKLIAGFESRCDCVFVYAANVKIMKDCGKISDCIGGAMLFGSENQQDATAELYEALSVSGRKIFEPGDITMRVTSRC